MVKIHYFHIKSFRSVQAWAVKLGTELYHFGEFITRKKEVQDVRMFLFILF